MNSTDNDGYHLQQSTTTPAAVQREQSGESHSDKQKLVNSTPNGYNSMSNHKMKSEDQSQQRKPHDPNRSGAADSREHKHGESSKHNSDHAKHRDSSSPLKHSSSSHSKPKDGANKISSSHRSSDPSKHSQDKEKKQKLKEGSEHSEHSKHGKNDVDRIKSEKSHKDKLSVSKHSSDSIKMDKSKDGSKHKEKPKDGHSSEHKIKDKNKDHHDKHRKSEGSKDSSHDKLKSNKSKDKPKEKTSDKHKDRTSDKPKDKMVEKSKEKSDKPKEKMDIKIKTEKPKEVKIKKEKESSHEKRETDVVKKERETFPAIKQESDFKKESVRAPAVVKVKQEVMSPVKSFESSDEFKNEESLPERKSKSKAGKRMKEESDFEDEEWNTSKKSKAKKAKAEAPKKRKKADSDFEEDKKPVKKKVKKVETKVNEAPAASPKKRGAKKEEEQDVWKWWEEEKKEDGVKWLTLQHSGPVFAPPYERVPKNVKFYYDGKHMELSEETEEVAGFYGRMLDHEYTTKEAFNTNFFRDWRKVMTSQEKESIKDLTKCNFSAFNDYYKMKSEERKNMTKEEKQAIKRENEELTQEYGFCIIDGHRQKIGNFKIEPPGLFRGRGEHPKMGMLKRRVQPEDITINIGKEAKAPEAPPGHRWKKILHDNKVTWLASWNENILNSTKYIMLNPSSKLKGEKDWQKYETARNLKKFVVEIRKNYTEDFKSKEMKVRQRAVALYFIDKLALRAGNEKDEDTADTVGCCSLRVEHITLHEEKDGKQFVVDFDFLGKDSIRYQNSVTVEKRAYKNLKLFMENKQPGDDIFDRLNTAILNKHLNELMEGLTAKVFRTYNASNTLQEQLDLLTKAEMSIPEKILAYNRANRSVAVLCNHQRAVPKTFSKSMENLKNKMNDKLQQIKEVKKEVKQGKSDAKNGSAKDRMLFEKKKKRLQQLEEQYKKLEVEATDKEENKQISLGTSKLNYLDPRISVAWCKKWEVPIEKIYNRTQRDKFRWAIEMAGPEYKF